jgi:2-polyprenyl-6-hydroxyphenyl methylase/3-demethylubiquinone-9 3-methyltransferase
MGVGATVRRAFGPYEREVAGAYRGIYLDLADFGRVLAAHRPKAERILEVGGGEGAVTELLARNYPAAQILSIDITERLGRLYNGPKERVEFRQANISEIAASHGAEFDLVMVSDVLHHIPTSQRAPFLREVARTLAPGGCLAIKDWERTLTPIHWLCFASDRWLTGDRIAFLTANEMRTLATQAVSGFVCESESRIAPWKNNFLQVYRWYSQS